ncbi:hypothetical protein [Chitinophaga sp. GbtcB8]|uniref:hypothetical protein n=1 Tax=Chitinophaga sp. GbtcB8 TaxID=2824753 RepID=UPI001C302EAB|nr:hypothetical protein [Chitinophaga sp. GbtcB8]
MDFKAVAENINLKNDWRKNVETSATHLENIMRAQMIGPNKRKEYFQQPDASDRWPTIKPGFDYLHVSPDYTSLRLV